MLLSGRSFPKTTSPPVRHPDTISMLVNDEQMKLDVWCTAGLQDFDFLRPLSYPEANVFLVCVSVASAASFHNVSAKWRQPPTHPAQPPCNAAQLLAGQLCKSSQNVPEGCHSSYSYLHVIRARAYSRGPAREEA